MFKLLKKSTSVKDVCSAGAVDDDNDDVGATVDGSSSTSQWYDVLKKPLSDAFARRKQKFACEWVWTV